MEDRLRLQNQSAKTLPLVLTKKKKTLPLVSSLPYWSQRQGNSKKGKMLAQEDETLPLNAGRSIVASSPGNLTEATKMKDESCIVGRENFVNALVSQLTGKKDDGANLRVISVVGEEAIGKTALVRSVYNRADVKHHFDCCTWVRVGPKPNLVHLMIDLLKQLRVPKLQDVDRMNEEKLSHMLQGFLIECCYLTVLDDLCDLLLMDKLIMVLPDLRNGSRVIVTTRNRNIHFSIDPWYAERLELSPLNQEQSEKLLETCNQAFNEVNPLEEHPKKGILRKSDGSPPKILLLGGLLSTATLDDLTTLLDRLPDCPKLQDVMDLSFNGLPELLKRRALYLALFPKESEIPTRRLFRLWSAAEQEPSTVAKVDAEIFFDHLVSRNMILVVRWKWDRSAQSCRLPGMLHDFFSQIAEHRRFLKIYDCSIHERLSDGAKFDAPHIAIHRHISGEREAEAQENVPEVGREGSVTNAQEARMEITSAVPHQRMPTSDNSMPCGIKELYSYVSFKTMKLGTQAKEIDALLKPLVLKRGTSVLTVLDLEGVYKPLLPEELGNILPKLKYLGLRWTLLESLPKSVVRLSSLETLDLKYTNITQVPVSIWEAKSLQHLYMNEVSFDESVHPQLHSKKSLNCNIQTIWGLCIGVESPTLNVLRKLTGLRKLALTCDFSAVKKATVQISNLNELKTLRLRSKDIFGQPSDLELSDELSQHKSLSNLYLLGKLKLSLLESHIPQNLKVLTLSMSGLEDNAVKVLGKLECLTTLRLFASSYDKDELSISRGTFLNLRVLKLWKLEKLTKWTVEANAMPRLADLEIKDCRKLKQIGGLWQIKTLEEITLIRVPDELEQRVRNKRPNVQIIAKELEKNKEKQSDEEHRKRGDEEDDYSEDFALLFEEVMMT